MILKKKWIRLKEETFYKNISRRTTLKFKQWNKEKKYSFSKINKVKLWKKKVFKTYYFRWNRNYLKRRTSKNLLKLKKKYFHLEKSGSKSVYNYVYRSMKNQPNFFIKDLKSRYQSKSSYLKRFLWKFRKRKAFFNKSYFFLLKKKQI